MLGLENFIEKDTFLVAGFLILIALTALLSERSGIINIALEGQLIAAVLGYTTFSFFVHHQGWNEHWEYFFALLGAVIFTFVITSFFAFFVITIKVNQILVALALNIFMFALANLVVVFIKNSPEISISSDYLSLYNSEEITSYLTINKGTVRVFEIILQFFVVLIIAYALNFFLFKTRVGLHLRSCGENPQISKINGISVVKFRYAALIIGGLLMAFAGSLLAEWKPGFSGGVDGFGYFGLAIMILGMRNIVGICFFSLFFTVSQTLVFTLADNQYKELINSINYVAPLLLLTVYGIFWKQKSGKNAVPKALGKV